MTDYEKAKQITAERDPETLRACAQEIRRIAESFTDDAYESSDNLGTRILNAIRLKSAEWRVTADDMEEMF